MPLELGKRLRALRSFCLRALRGIGLRARRGLGLRALRVRWIECAPRAFARWCTPDDDELGRLGEALAARSLARAGWRIDARRVRTAHVEVDLVAREGGVRVLVEVKSGRAFTVPRPRGTELPPPRWRPGQRFDARRATRLARLARELARHGGLPVRVDLVEVFLEPHTGRVTLAHQRGTTHAASTRGGTARAGT